MNFGTVFEYKNAHRVVAMGICCGTYLQERYLSLFFVLHSPISTLLKNGQFGSESGWVCVICR